MGGAVPLVNEATGEALDPRKLPGVSDAGDAAHGKGSSLTRRKGDRDVAVQGRKSCAGCLTSGAAGGAPGR